MFCIHRRNVIKHNRWSYSHTRRELLELLAAVGVLLEHACECRGAVLQGTLG